MKNSKYLKALGISIIASAFMACGGSSSKENNTPPTNTPTPTPTTEVPTSSPQSNEEVDQNVTSSSQSNEELIANAGVDQNVTFGNQAILSAVSSSDEGNTLSYEWSLDGVKLSSEKSFVMEVFPKEGAYKFDLKVTNSKGESKSDSMTVLTYSDTVVTLKTNQGDISLKMKSDIAPKAVENFVTHSKNGYYDSLTFHRVMKDFMIQGGDPDGTGRGGESIWGEAFEDEFDSSVRFDKPYLLAMANAGPNTNGSQFFITVKETEWLNDKHTIFGEVVEGKDIVHKVERSGNSKSKIKKATVIFEIPKESLN